jgi:hypothetical protein
MNAPAVLLAAGLLQHLIKRKCREKPVHRPSIERIRLQHRLLVNGLTHRSQGGHADHSLDLITKRQLLKDTEQPFT